MASTPAISGGRAGHGMGGRPGRPRRQHEPGPQRADRRFGSAERRGQPAHRRHGHAVRHRRRQRGSRSLDQPAGYGRRGPHGRGDRLGRPARRILQPRPAVRGHSLKPDIAAPGVDILAAKAGGNAADGWYQSMSGTSMATPNVAGAAAILAQRHPEWHAAELKNPLMSTAKRLDGFTAYQVGS